LGFVLLALALVFGLAVTGCDTGGGGGGGGGDDKGFTSNLTGLNAKLVKNEYAEDSAESRGLQAKFDNKLLMNGKQVKKDDEFTLQITLKVDKALDYDLEIGLVDTTVGESEGYWRTLTWDNKNPDDSMYKIPKAELTADTEITKEIKLTALKDASSAAAAANTLVFECRDVWTKAPVTISFVSFLFIKGDGGDSGEIPTPPPPPASTSVKVTVGLNQVDAEVKAVGGEVEVDESGFTYTGNGAGGYGNEYPKFIVDLGSGKTLSDFTTLKLTYQGVSGDIGWKGFYVQALEAEPNGYFNISENNVASYNYSNDGKTAMDVTFTLDTDKIATITTQEVWFVVNIHAAATGSDDKPTSFTITNIVLE